MKTLLSIAALGLVSATPAIAQPFSPSRAAPAANAPALVAPAPTGSAGSVAKPTRYCVMQESMTGSRLRKKVCNTREDWLKQGFDPLDPKKN